MMVYLNIYIKTWRERGCGRVPLGGVFGFINALVITIFFFLTERVSEGRLCSLYVQCVDYSFNGFAILQNCSCEFHSAKISQYIYECSAL